MSRKMQRDKFRVPNENWEPLLDLLEEVCIGLLEHALLSTEHVGLAGQERRA